MDQSGRSAWLFSITAGWGMLRLVGSFSPVLCHTKAFVISIAYLKHVGLLKWRLLPGNFRGAIWALIAALMFSGMQVSIKQAGETLPVWEILVLRSLIALCFILPAIQRQGFHTLRTSRPKIHLLRALLGFGGISTLILALKHLELGVVATLVWDYLAF